MRLDSSKVTKVITAWLTQSVAIAMFPTVPVRVNFGRSGTLADSRAAVFSVERRV